MKTNGVRIEFGPITVDNVQPHLSNKNKHRAQLRQSVTTHYPAARVGNSLQDSVFDAEEFNFPADQTFSGVRIAWIDVPVGKTKEEVEAQIKTFPKARIYRVLRCIPILTDEEKAAMESGLSRKPDGSPKTLKDYALAQMVPDENGNPVVFGAEKVPVFKRTFFSTQGQEDVDLRASDYAKLRSENKLKAFELNERPARAESQAEPAIQDEARSVIDDQY